MRLVGLDERIRSYADGESSGLLRHCTDAEIESNYVDTHGASVVGFAFTEPFNFRLLPWLKNMGSNACTAWTTARPAGRRAAPP
ncbi:Tn3 family transposase [Streptomyces sp. SBT349]|uniref:Tn3 family transposase n=1 Tax=Streptomyces sp. SBT349 TaxID=1580539 RepID=UPI00066B2678|nr:Tn3 family transposase [Streptomyces sp. SBT349]